MIDLGGIDVVSERLFLLLSCIDVDEDELDLHSVGQDAFDIDGNGISLKAENVSGQGSGSTISVFFTLKNTGKAPLALSDLKLEYYFTKDSKADLQFWCDHSALSGSAYEAVTESVKGAFHTVSDAGEQADTKLVISSGSLLQLKPGDEWQIQVRIAKEDWSEMKFSNDYSAAGSGYITVYYADTLLSGKKPE